MKTRPTPAGLALWVALPMAQTVEVERRLTLILAQNHCRRQITRRVLLAVLGLSGALLVPLAMLQPMARAQTMGEGSSESTNVYASLRPSQEEEKRIGQARQLRGHLRKWAQRNHALLVQMTHAKPDDLAALMRVYDSFSRLPSPLWSGDPRVSRSAESAAMRDTWGGLTQGLTLTHLQRSHEPIDKMIRKDFAKYRDFRVASSRDPGRVSIVLWGSGRITRATLSDKFMGHGKPILWVEHQDSIMPGFFGR